MRYYFFGNWKVNKQLYDEVRKRHYDLIFLAKPYNINPKIISKVNKYANTWYFFMDSLGDAIKNQAVLYAKSCTWSSATFSNVNKFFRKNGANSFFITEGYDPTIFMPTSENKTKKINVIFVGSISPKRLKYIKFLRKNNIKVVCHGYGWENPPIYNKKLAEKYRKTKIVLNFTRDKIGFSDRVLLAMGTGSFVLSEYCKDLDTLFKRKKHLDFFDSPKSLLNKIRYYLKNEDVREQIAVKSQIFVFKNFTWNVIMNKILRIIEKENKFLKTIK